MSVGEDAYHANLQLTTAITKQQYCSDGSVRFSLQFEFKNTGEQRIILDQLKPVVAGYMVSRDEKAALTKRHETTGRRLIGMDNTTMSFDSQLEESQFVILKPGEAYKVGETFSLSDSASLRSGPHVLQLAVLTWYHPRISNVEWRIKWRGKGYLWTDSITSRPMPFSLSRPPMVSDCYD